MQNMCLFHPYIFVVLWIVLAVHLISMKCGLLEGEFSELHMSLLIK